MLVLKIFHNHIFSFSPLIVKASLILTDPLDMQVDSPLHMWALLVCALSVGTLSAWGVVCALKRLCSPSPAIAATKALATLFDERVRHFQHQVKTLQDHSHEYVAIFSGDEWEELTRSIDHLVHINRQVQTFIAKRDFAEATNLLSELYDPVRHPLDSLQSDIDELRASTIWEDSVRTMLKRVIQNLETAAHETRRLAQPSPRKRTSTLVTLADVKKALLEDAAFKRGR